MGWRDTVGWVAFLAAILNAYIDCLAAGLRSAIRRGGSCVTRPPPLPCPAPASENRCRFSGMREPSSSVSTTITTGSTKQFPRFPHRYFRPLFRPSWIFRQEERGLFDIWTRIGGREMGEGIVRGERKSGGERVDEL